MHHIFMQAKALPGVSNTKRLDMQAVNQWLHKSAVPIVKAELPNPSSCFIVPLSIGQSLKKRIPVSTLPKKLIGAPKGRYFLLVLIWPT